MLIAVHLVVSGQIVSSHFAIMTALTKLLAENMKIWAYKEFRSIPHMIHLREDRLDIYVNVLGDNMAMFSKLIVIR